MIYYVLFNSNLTGQQAVTFFLMVIFAYFVSIAVRDFARALVAVKMGDPTPKQAGRLTLNPFKHVDFSGFLFFVFVGISWSKPVPVNPLNFKKYRTGSRLISIIGIVANIVLGLVAAGIYAILLATVGYASSGALYYVYEFLPYLMLVNSFLAMFNLLPIFPMDGFSFIVSFMKTENNFIKFSVRNGVKIICGIIIASLLTDLLFGFDLLDWYLTILYNFVYVPISLLGVL